MDENMLDFITMVTAAFLFVFALSCAILSYNKLETRLEAFFDIHPITAKRGEASSELIKLSKIERKAKFQEIFMAILDMPKYATMEGNLANKVIVNASKFYVLVEEDPSTMITTTFIVREKGGDIRKYNIAIESEMNDLVEEIVYCALDANITGFSSSNIAFGDAAVEGLIRGTTFSVSYTEDIIEYKRNT